MLSPVVHQLYVLLYFMARIMHGQSLCSCNEMDSGFASGVNLIYYKCNNNNDTVTYPITKPQELVKVLEDKRTIFYIFGYLQYPGEANVQLMMKALCYGRTDNVVLLDWSKYSQGLYPVTFENAEKVGSLFAQSLKLLVNSGLHVSNIYIVGHSLGAHIAGLAGKCNGFVIPRITGLDPASLIYYPLGCYLKSTDAAWIDVIHTDMGGYGTTTHMGTAEYYANDGARIQPGCPKGIFIPGSAGDVCSHQKSVVDYAISKYQPDTFTAVECSSYDNFQSNECINNRHTRVGYAASDVNGVFYFNTTGAM